MTQAAILEKAPARTSAPPAGDLRSVVVFIPALDEEERLGDVIRSIKHLYGDRAAQGYAVKVIVVDDGSSDGTVRVAEEAGADRVVSHGRNLGLGAATRTGLRTAREMGADIAVKMDADFQHDPADIHGALQPILENRADIVYGSRFTGRICYRMPLVRLLGNRFFTWLMRKLTGWPITDSQTGLIAFGRRYLEDFNMPGDYNPPQQALIDAYHRHLRYGEVPVVFYPRTAGKSFISLKYPFKAFPQMIRTLMLVCPLKVFVPLGSISVALGVLLGALELSLNLAGVREGIDDGTIVVLISLGVQSFFFGLLADMMLQKR